MKILWHSVAPWTNTGYGQQTAVWAERIKKLGHEVIISAFYGLMGAPTSWKDIVVLPNIGTEAYGSDSLAAHARYINPDIVISLGDVWVLNHGLLKGLPLACWYPVDTEPASLADQNFIQNSGAESIAMSRYGEEKLREAGCNPFYAPHGIDTSVFDIQDDRAKTRAEMGFTGKFVIGINGANQDQCRKGHSEQILAFAKFHAKHPDSILYLHTSINSGQGIDIGVLARRLNLQDKIKMSDQYLYNSGLIPAENLARWYNSIDFFSNFSYGEGFGLPIIEAQACGVPVGVTNASSMIELAGPGSFKIDGTFFWNKVHQGWWTKPDIDEIANTYEEAYAQSHASRKDKRTVQEKCREFALNYDADKVLHDHWEPVLKGLQARLAARAAK